MEATCRKPGMAEPRTYRPRRRERTLLHRLVRENLETFLRRAREACPDDDPGRHFPGEGGSGRPFKGGYRQVRAGPDGMIF